MGNKAGLSSSSKSPGANKSFGGKSNYSLLQQPNGLSNTGGGRIGAKPNSIAMGNRMNDFDNPLTSNTMDV